MPKQVTLRSGRHFKSITAAKAHFCGLREKTHLEARLPEPHKSDAIDVYERYCAVTGWPAEDAVDVTVTWDNKERPAGPYAPTKAYAIITGSGSTSVFSMDRALRAIAD
ncbi:hypothetical protein [Bosea sp. PAMC 26642]|uniref:hypothetical protein n=1 Tax=Bosea sp. (strain PAMC 26642) TaxID=1792307 RepID=UPI0012E70A5E|nr:hypothetical protein [Bosea sp. PAMC 26642]